MRAIALTDHDSVEGCGDAVAEGHRAGVRVIPGCEFSVAAPWGELHLLAYFVPFENAKLVGFIRRQQEMRIRRAHLIVRRLRDAGVRIDVKDVFARSEGGAIGRPHVARVLVEYGAVADVSEAFRKYLGANRPGFVPKELPSLPEVAKLVRSLGAVSSAAHLGSLATRTNLRELKSLGVDAVEVLHPAHAEPLASRISKFALETGMLRTGGSDWHGEDVACHDRAVLGGVEIPEEWLRDVERFHAERLASLSPRP